MVTCYIDVMKTIGRIIKITVALLLLFVLATIAINVYCVTSTRDNVHTVAQIEGNDMTADAIVVLGASVYSDGTPSDILADRLETAADVYKAGAAPAIIVSGDNRTEHYNESDAMKTHLVTLGVPEDAIYVDRAGYDTYDSMYRAHFVFGADRLIVVTQAYHLYRALMIAHLLGAEADGVAADKGSYDNQRQYSIRDYVARDKDFVQALLKLPPADSTQPIEN